ncbi:MAG TPA: PEGA domain-containing protein [Bdellovibrionota bacterium]|nr:PEGA domain-containing protein [Bdellovibrionota bacterium]
MQETEALRSTIAKAPDFDSVIPLAGDDSTPQLAPVPASAAPRMDRSFIFEDRKRERRKLALTVFLGFSVIIPGLLIAAGWAQHFLNRSLETDSKQDVSRRLKNSEVIRAMETKRQLHYASDGTTPVTEQDGRISIETFPPGAYVYINDRRYSKGTPLHAKSLPPNTTLHVLIRKDGYEDSDHFLNIAPGEEREITVVLTRRR